MRQELGCSRAALCMAPGSPPRAAALPSPRCSHLLPTSLTVSGTIWVLVFASSISIDTSYLY